MMKEKLLSIIWLSVLLLNACSSADPKPVVNQVEMEMINQKDTLEKKVESVKVEVAPDNGVLRGILKSVQESKYYDLYFESYYLTLVVDGKEQVEEYYSPVADIQLYVGNEVVLPWHMEPYCQLHSYELWSEDLPEAKIRNGLEVGLGTYHAELSMESAKGGTTDTPNKYSVKLDNGLEATAEDFLTVEDVAFEGKRVRAYYSVGKSLVFDTIRPVKSLSELVSAKKDHIKEVYKQIRTGLDNDQYRIDTLQTEGEGSLLRVERAYNGEELVYAKVQDINDHGTEGKEFYFDQGKIVFVFKEYTHWVGNTDEVKELRLYFLEDKLINGLERQMTGTGGYEAVKKILAKKEQNTIDLSSIDDYYSQNSAYYLSRLNKNDLRKQISRL